MNEGDLWEMAGGENTDEIKDLKDNEAVKSRINREKESKKWAEG